MPHGSFFCRDICSVLYHYSTDILPISANNFITFDIFCNFRPTYCAFQHVLTIDIFLSETERHTQETGQFHHNWRTYLPIQFIDRPAFATQSAPAAITIVIQRVPACSSVNQRRKRNYVSLGGIGTSFFCNDKHHILNTLICYIFAINWVLLYYIGRN